MKRSFCVALVVLGVLSVDQYSQQVQNENRDLSAEFSSICNSHTDYLWDTKISRP